MKFAKRIKSQIIFSTCLLSLLITACSAGPSDRVIKSAIEKSVENQLKQELTMEAFWQTKNVTVDSVEILRTGEFKKEDKSVLVQARVRGTLLQDSLPNLGLPPSRNCRFEGTDEVKVYQNDYGDWVGQSTNWGASSNFRRNCDK